MKAPPGYAKPDAAAPDTDPARPVLGFVALLAVLALLSAHELLVRQANAYLAPASDGVRWPPLLAPLGALALGVGLAGRAPVARAARWLPYAALALSVLAGLAPLAAFAAFERGATSTTCSAFAIAGLGLLGATLGAAWRCFGRAASQLGVVERVLHPLRALGLLLSIGAAVSALSALGLLRSGAALGLVWCVIAAWCPLLATYVGGAPPSAVWPRRVLHASLGGLVLNGSLLLLAERLVPSAELGVYPNEVVWADTSRGPSLVVTSGQSAFELFVDRRLRVSSLVERRYFEALVQPALGVARRRTRVLLLGAGEGMAERELLRHADVDHVTLVVVDARLVRTAARMPWLAERAERALESPKLEVVEAEPLPWLMTSPRGEPYDVAIVDLPDPIDATRGKHFTRYFYRQLAEHLTPDGVVALQATNAFVSPRTAASIAHTVESAGFVARPYHASVPTLGDWGFVLATKGPRSSDDPLAATPGATYLDGATLRTVESRPPDLTTTDADAEVNTLDHQVAVETFEVERGRRRR